MTEIRSGRKGEDTEALEEGFDRIWPRRPTSLPEAPTPEEETMQDQKIGANTPKARGA